MKKILLILSLLISINVAGQGEAANWYFGENAGIQFNQSNGTVTSVNGGQLVTREGCATISDADGNLLFYTDGLNVYNRTHAIMQNGTGLLGDKSSTQSAIIVPKPDDPNIYYIFTVDIKFQNEPEHHGFNYSTVDMSLAGGLGAVTTDKNIKLLDRTSEKITAVLKDCVDKSIWVVTFAAEDGNLTDPFNTYHAFEITNLGVNPVAVKSTFSDLTIADVRGYLKLSPDGTKMACANMKGDFNFTSNSNQLLLYDFDETTGIVSNQQRLSINTQSIWPYGVEFSPDSQLLYIHSSNDQPAGAPPLNHIASLSQFNLTVSDIQGSEFTVDEQQLYRGALQLGPDGKIYRALSANYNTGLPFLGVINNPNVIGIGSNYQHNAISVSPNVSTQGLPPFLQSIFNTQVDIIRNGESATNLALCEGDTYTLEANDLPGATYTWSLDGIPLADNNFDLTISQGGHYELYIDPNNGDCPIEGEAFVIYNPNPETFNDTLIQCDEDGVKDGFTIFNLTEANDALTGGIAGRSTKFFLNLSDAQNNTGEIDGNAFNNTINPQTIYVQVINDITGCFDIAELTLDVSLTNANDAVLTMCDDDGSEDGFYSFNLADADADVLNGLPPNVTINYYKTYNDALLEQSPLANPYVNTVPYNHTIYVRVENDNACYGINQVQLTVFELPDIAIEDESLYCLNFFPQTITLTGGIVNDLPSNYFYLWSTGETTADIEVNQPGSYTVTVTNSNGCTKDRTITVIPSNIATFGSIEVVDVAQNNTVTVFVSGEGEYSFALDDINGPYQDNNLFENVAPGFHTVYVRDDKNNCGIVDQLVSVIGFPQFFTPNQDSYNDTWQVYGVSSQFQPNTKILIFDRYGKLLKQLDPLGPGWNGTFNGQSLPSNDYWFQVTLQDGRIFKSHFTLKH